ncbi:MAG: helix-turn-helix domain-containing protein [Erythrobacter sp.]|nr:helix-turn-helix domain-containing protein [Erythrobacter sp.]
MEKPMLSGAARRLTDRQQAVMEGIDRRVPIKVIAQELGVSETRINQHIRALKDVYAAASLGELVENYRATLPPAPADNIEDEAPVSALLGEPADTGAGGPFSEAAYTKKQIPQPAIFADQLTRDDPGRLVMSDVMPLLEQAPWLRPGEPRVVPGVLDGEHAVLFRLGAIVGIASGILAAVVLTITAAVTLSDATEGKATISVEQKAVTG